MQQLLDLFGGAHIEPTALLDIGLTALLFYGLFSLIQGTRAVRLVIGAIVLYVVYVAAQALNLRLLSGILQTGAVVGLLALVVIFQPELRRALERIGRVGSLSWIAVPGTGSFDTVATVLARTAVTLASQRIGALIVVERETGLEDAAEGGIMLHADLSVELLQSIFTPHTALHDGAVIIRNEKVLAAGVVLPLSETATLRERYGTRHRAAIGISEQTDAVAIVVSEESGHVSLVERGRVLRALDEERLRTALRSLLRPSDARGRAASSVAKLGPARLVNAGRHRRMRLRMEADLRTGADGTPVVPVAPAPPPGTPPGTPPGGPAAMPGSAGRAE
jgi:diadenylate cyclase